MNTLKVYRLDTLGVLLGQVNLPAKAPINFKFTLKAPPDLKEGEFAQFIGGAWGILSEYPSPPHIGAPEVTYPKQYPRFTGVDKLALFDPERRDITFAAMSDLDVKMFYDALVTADYISYENPLMEQGLSLMVSKGLLTEARKAEIIETMKPA